MREKKKEKETYSHVKKERGRDLRCFFEGPVWAGLGLFYWVTFVSGLSTVWCVCVCARVFLFVSVGLSESFIHSHPINI